MITNAIAFNKRPITVEAVLEASDLTGGANTVTFLIDSALSGRTFKYVATLKSSVGLAKSGFTSTYDTATGVLSVSDTATEFATGDVITVIGILL